MKSNTELLRELARLIANNAPKEEILHKGMEIKAQIIEAWQRLGADMSLLDSLVKTFAPDETWPSGWRINPTPSPEKVRDTTKAVRIKTVLRIATEIADEKRAVTSAEIADRLITEGDSRPKKNIMVSVGNILGKNMDWQKVGIGEYAKKGTKKEDKSASEEQ